MTTKHLEAQDIVEDVEFELAHGSLGNDELSQSIEALRQYQNSVRASIFGDAHNLDVREIARRQFQLNDMLLTALHEMALKLNESRMEQRALAAWVREQTLKSSVDADDQRNP